jgi:bacterioferritin
MPAFTTDVEQIRNRARQKIEEGAVTQAYKGDAKKAVEILNEALATEIVCVLRYMHHYFMATGVHGMSVRDEFKEHADAEREHADALADRIQQLGGKPDFNPKSLLERSASQYVEGSDLSEMIKEDLIAERIVIEVYSDMIRYFGNNDPTTRILLERLLRDEEEHASDLSDLLYVIDPHTGETEGQDPGTKPLQFSAKSDKQNAQPQEKQNKNGKQKIAAESRVRQNQPLPTISGKSSKSDRSEAGAEKNWKIAKPKGRKPAA